LDALRREYRSMGDLLGRRLLALLEWAHERRVLGLPTKGTVSPKFNICGVNGSLAVEVYSYGFWVYLGYPKRFRDPQRLLEELASLGLYDKSDFADGKRFLKARRNLDDLTEEEFTRFLKALEEALPIQLEAKEP